MSEHEQHSEEEFCLNYIEYSIGECYVTYFENADDSGKEEEDLELLKDFKESIKDGRFIMTDNDLGFTQCDVSGLYNNCIEYRLYKGA